MSDDFYQLLIPLFGIPAAAGVVVLAFLYIRTRWEGYKARRRAEGRD